MMRRYTHRRGISLIWTALLLIVWVGVLGLAIDVGHGFRVGSQLQAAADAAALAGAQPIRSAPVQIRLAAAHVASKNTAARTPVHLAVNEANVPDGDIVLGRYNLSLRRFTPTVEAVNAVKVVARRTNESGGGNGDVMSDDGPVPLLFGPIFGVDVVSISRAAIVKNVGGPGAGIIALCPTCEGALDLNGAGRLVLKGGVIQVDSTSSCAVRGSGSVVIDAPGLDVAGGGVCLPQGMMDPVKIDTAATPLGDPLAHLPELELLSIDRGTINGRGIYDPGYYSGGIALTGSAPPVPPRRTGPRELPPGVTLRTGIYFLGGAGLQITSDINFTAEGCLFVILPEEGRVNITGARVRMTPRDAPPYQGVTIYQSRLNTNAANIVGSPLLDISGTLYFPASSLRIAGRGAGFGNQLIAWTIDFDVTGVIAINYNGNFPPRVNGVYLVK